ncbi:MAG TPA: hypothetical protein VNN21_04470 [Dehalococcoidia bacterium]|nr:hypothetical protein [Dehalococcoidia bacterium]
MDVEQDLQDVYFLADEDGMRLIHDEARARGEDLTAVLTEMDGAYDAAMWALLNRPTLFAELIKFRAADTLNRRSWHHRAGVVGDPDTSPAALERLSLTLTDYLLREEGRGHHCHIDHYARSTGHLFVAYPEDFSATLLEYDDENNLARRAIRPATDLLFFYRPDHARLEVYATGGKKKVRDLQHLFARTILGASLGPDQFAGKAYDLNLLKDGQFSFLIDPDLGLAMIEVKAVHLRDRMGGRGLTLEVLGHAGDGVLRVAERYFSIEDGTATGKYPLAMMDIDRAILTAHFRPLGKRRRGRTRTFAITSNGCALDQEGLDGLIRRVLVDSGLEQPPPGLLAA